MDSFGFGGFLFGFPFGFFLGGFLFFLAPAPFFSLDIGGLGVIGIFGLDIVEVVDDHIAIGEIGAGKKRLAEAGASLGEFSVAAYGGTGGHVFGRDLVFLRDIDDAFAFGIAGAA